MSPKGRRGLNKYSQILSKIKNEEFTISENKDNSFCFILMNRQQGTCKYCQQDTCHFENT